MRAMAAVMGVGESDTGYLIWAYMVLPAIRKAVKAGAWDRDATLNLFTAEYS